MSSVFTVATIRSWLTRLALAAATLLLVPPSFVWARQMALVASADASVGAPAAIGELWSAFANWEAYHRNPATISHPYEYPYLECDARIGARGTDKQWQDYFERGIWFVAAGEEELTRVFMIEHDWRLNIAYQSVLQDHYSTPVAALLTACIEASVLASLCAERVRSVAYGQSDKVEAVLVGRLADRTRAQTYCHSLKGIREVRS